MGLVSRMESFHTYEGRKHGSSSPRSSSVSISKKAPVLLCLVLVGWTITVFRRSFLQIQFNCERLGGGAPWQQHQRQNPLLFPRRVQSFSHYLTAEPLLGAALSRGSFFGEILDSEIPTLTIFTVPRPFNGHRNDPQRRALLSWLRLTPTPRVVLLGTHPSFRVIAEEFPDHVSVDDSLDSTFQNVPQVHAVIARAQAAETDVSMVVSSDVMLLSDVTTAIRKLNLAFDNWMVTAARWEVGERFPYSFEPAAWEQSVKSGKSIEKTEAMINKWIRSHGSVNTNGELDLWIWNNPSMPLYAGHMPPFAVEAGHHGNWLTHEAIAAGIRQVIDATDSITVTHAAHKPVPLPGKEGAPKGVGEGGVEEEGEEVSWEEHVNAHLAGTHGTYDFQLGAAWHAPWHLAACFEPSSSNMCLLRRERAGSCTCEIAPYVRKTTSDVVLLPNNKTWGCGEKESRSLSSLPLFASEKESPPRSMESVLRQVAREVDGTKVVTLLAVTFGYADMLMSFVCRLRQLKLADNIVVAALDEEIYKYAYTQGLAVYYERASEKLKGVEQEGCSFGSQCFRQFTKSKSKAVLRVLKAGYSVLWSDVDIVWYTDPLPDLMDYGPGTFPIQSNEPNGSLPGSGIRRINSGFYFARADPMTVEAFAAITEHAAKTQLSEQPSFYDVLCGEKGELRVKGGEECRWKNGLRTIFLDRKKYPNGASHDVWKEKDVTAACLEQGCVILHNNWISGKDAKVQRLVKNEYWHYNGERRMCSQPWLTRLKNLPSGPRHS